jgi:hypothetical protein
MKNETNWKKPDTVIAVLALVFAVLSLMIGVVISVYSLNTANQANDYSKTSADAAQTANNLTEQALTVAQQANNMTQQSIQLSNFNTTIIPYPVVALFDKSIEFEANQTNTWIIELPKIYYINGTTTQMKVHGWFNFTLNIISPHYGNVTIENPRFEQYLPAGNFINFTYLNINFLNLYHDGKLLPSTQGLPFLVDPVSYVAPGVSNIDFTISLNGFLNSEIYSSNDPTLHMSGPLLLGTAKVDAVLFDMQTNEKLTVEVWSLMYAQVEFAFK